MGIDYIENEPDGEQESPTASTGDDECPWKTQYFPEGDGYVDDIDEVEEE